MGILNITPDSFSDGGDFLDPQIAVNHGMQMVAEGADIIDVGGESTRPGAERIPAREQLNRVLPVIEGLRSQVPGHILISVDTTLADVARAAVDAGAGVLNDISAAGEDQGILALAAERGLPVILMHMQGTPLSMQDNPEYGDVVGEIRDYLLQRAALAASAGVSEDNIILDPGFGFGKTPIHNMQLLANLHRLADTGYPVMIGTSRKSFLAAMTRVTDRKQLVGATCATTVMGVQAGVKLFRVHDVLANRQAADMAWEAIDKSL